MKEERNFIRLEWTDGKKEMFAEVFSYTTSSADIKKYFKKIFCGDLAKMPETAEDVENELPNDCIVRSFEFYE